MGWVGESVVRILKKLTGTNCIYFNLNEVGLMKLHEKLKRSGA